MIHDFKALKNSFPLDFDIKLDNKPQQVYCFIGENGVGKTKLLESMAKSMLYSHTMFDKTRDTSKKYSALYANYIVNDAIKNLTLHGLAKEIVINQINVKNVEVDKFDVVKFAELSNTRQEFGFEIDEPIIFISAKNRGYISGANPNGNIQLPQSNINNFVYGFINTFRSMNGLDIAVDSVTTWFLQRLVINPDLVRGVEQLFAGAIYVLECLSTLVLEWNLLQKNENGDITTKASYSNGEFLMDNIPIQHLSTGYASILRIVQEIVAGIDSWHETIDFRNAKAIIFIDEIDLHLHPKWQMKIIGILKEFFPKATFYVTTHSPLVLFNLKNGESYKLNKDEKNLVTAEKIIQTNMHFLADIVKEFFDVEGISVRSVDKETMLKARKDFLKLMEENGVNDE